MLNIINVYQKELEKRGVVCDLNTTGKIDKDYDIVHGHYSLTKPVIKAGLRSKAKGIPFIIHHHGSDLRRITEDGAKSILPHHIPVTRFVRSLADEVLMSTPDLLDWGSGLYLPNPVDIDKFRPMDMEKTDRVLLFGRFASKKALLSVLKEDEKYDILNWGVEIKLPGNVRKIPFHPHHELPHLLNRYQRMIGSLLDPVSLARLEAMACGLQTYTDFPKRLTVYYGFENPDHTKDPRGFVKRYHSPSKVVKLLMKIYEDISLP